MENQLQIYNSDEFGEVRVVMRDGEPWFVAADVCRVLEHSNPSVAVSRLDDDEKQFAIVPQQGVNNVYTPCAEQQMLVISESGLYALTITSRKPKAKKFRKWLTGEVAVSIRKTGRIGGLTQIKEVKHMEKQIVTILDVRGYCENGTAFVSVEDIARKLGFVKSEEKVSTTCGRKTYEVIRWARINGYLREFAAFLTENSEEPIDAQFTAVKAGDYIPEQVAYLLAMKASNEVAKAFQWKLANKIIPEIRKTGSYSEKPLDTQAVISPDFLRRIADELEAKDKQIAVLKPKADYCDMVLQSPDLVPISVIAKDYGKSGVGFNRLLYAERIQYKIGNVWVLYQEYANRGWTKTKTHTYNDAEGKPHSTVHTYWTQKGRLELYQLLKKRGILPTVEKQAA